MQESEASPPLVALRALFLLMRPGVGLSPSEVRLYGLHQRPKQGGNTAAGTYIGEAPWVLLCRRLNRSSNQFLSDKLRLSYLLAGSKINAPRTLAYLGVRSPLLAVPELQSKAKLVRFLRQQAT